MPEREKISTMDLKAHINNLRKNPKYTEDILKLVEADLQFGLSVAETEEYLTRKFDYAQMKVYSKCLRNGYPKEVRDCIAKEGMTGEQMAVALEFYQKGVPLPTVAEITENSGQTAFTMKKLFQTVLVKLQEATAAPGNDEIYAKELLEQIKAIVEKIEYQEKRYDALNEKLKEIQTAGADASVQNNLLAQLTEKDGLLEKQQNEINDARATIARLRNEIDGIRKEKDSLEGKSKELENAIHQMRTEEQAPPEKRDEPQADGINQASSYPYLEYRSALVDQNGKIVSFAPIDHVKNKSRTNVLSEIFSRLTFKKKIDIVRLVAEKDLEPKQLIQIRSAIEKGLSEEQLLVLIDKQIPAEQMEEIIQIAVYENKQRGTDHGTDCSDTGGQFNW